MAGSKKIFSPLGASNHSNSERVDLDYYATDPAAVDALLSCEDISKEVLEPCCGEGHISRRMEQLGHEVVSFDIVNRGYDGQQGTWDFLKFEPDVKNSIDIVTNPPYKQAAEFVEHAMEISEDGVKIAMFLKLTFLEGQKRKELFDKYPPARIHVFRKRIACWPNGDKSEIKSSAVCYAWFVFEKGFVGNPEIHWID